jgi:hypothetical protein
LFCLVVVAGEYGDINTFIEMKSIPLEPRFEAERDREREREE